MNKKKICVGIIVGLVVICIICYGIVFLNSKNKEIEKENTNEIPDNSTIENKETAINDEEINANIESEQIAEVYTKTKQEETQDLKQETGQIQSSNVKSSIASSTKQTGSNAPTETNKSQTAQAKQNEQPQASQNQPTSGQVPNVTTEEKKQENTKTTTNEEKYVRNDTMINRIRQVIQSNESEYIKNYGYEIVVDSSIKGQTNQFTFTETRVKSYLTYKFGTIRIYAEDYYNNGQLIMTECYIL